MTIDFLIKALHESWDRDTAYKTDRPYWNELQKEIGQCAVTSIIVYDYFGGKIIRGYSKKYNLFHYWNEINGQKIDLTYKQFIGTKDDIFFENTIFKSKKELIKIHNVRQRYELLKQRVEDYLKHN